MPAETPLREIPLFASLPDQALMEILSALKTRQLADGEILFRQGDPGDYLVIVKEGKIAIFTPSSEAPDSGQAIRLFQPGEMLGEMAIIDRKPRSTSARADGPAVVNTLGGDEFTHLIRQNPDVALEVMAGLSQRVRYDTEFLNEVRQWVRRVAEGNYQVSGEASGYKDRTIAALAAEFVQMAAKVKEREETLRQEVAQLRIEIDEAKRRKEADQIMGSDYYKSLKDKVKAMRAQRED